jgi:hypothetical protein
MVGGGSHPIRSPHLIEDIMTSDPTTPAPEARTATKEDKPRQSVTARRVGYAISIAVNALLIGLIYVEPGWRVLPFLTEDAVPVIALVVMSMIVTIAVNLVWIAHDPLWLRSLGDLVTTIVSIVVLSRLLSVFPFSFSDDSPWDLVVRILLIVGLVGASIGAVVHLVTFIHRVVNREPDRS